ncbi:GNAT family N-acetyltransferase [Virgibacillus sp. W0430]|uniref:GNAT family N-acetyltransferase n=1 Tax=Virgibacillus sp. W0430 TaxID=3391580 RepID=UPI003F463086
MFIVQVNEELNMRMLAVRDAQALFEITERSREHLRSWLPWIDEMNCVNDSLQFIKQSFHSYAERSSLTAGIFYKEELAGVIGFNQFDWKNKIGYIGYWLAIDYEGRGIMTQAVQTLTDYAFRELKLNRVDIRAAAKNKRSRAIPERLGFSEEGLLRQAEWLYDHYVDHVVYGMLYDDWKHRQSG